MKNINGTYGTAYMDMSDNCFKLSDIINHDGKSYFVDTCYVPDADCLETMVFKLKRPVPDDYDPFENMEKFEKRVDWVRDLFVARHKSKAEAKRVHIMVCENLRKFGDVRAAVN